MEVVFGYSMVLEVVKQYLPKVFIKPKFKNFLITLTALNCLYNSKFNAIKFAIEPVFSSIDIEQPSIIIDNLILPDSPDMTK